MKKFVSHVALVLLGILLLFGGAAAYEVQSRSEAPHGSLTVQSNSSAVGVLASPQGASVASPAAPADCSTSRPLDLGSSYESCTTVLPSQAGPSSAAVSAPAGTGGTPSPSALVVLLTVAGAALVLAGSAPLLRTLFKLR